ncbi:hypothetical protein WJX81_001128 [Elliptochloris bilobata]|uniref:ABC transporter domain-containing protein n=1 Tax=Elliptochloris bilobata TaxID=381761 RepID=A0AAW1RJC7_9CHLO
MRYLQLRDLQACACVDRWVAPIDLEQGASKGSAGTGAEELAHLRVQCPADLAWVGLACQVVDKHTLTPKCILAPCAGVVMPGELCALVGPSGAGKSTLLDILAQRKGGAVTGKVLVNGRPVDAAFRRHSAYVPQEDAFVPTLSAWETLEFHAWLRSPQGTSAEEVHARMHDALAVMGLWRVRNTPVGGVLPGGIRVRGLSGGEQRRLSIACALVAQPSILFLDEPTTGLDSFAALNIMDHMSCLAALGHTIITTLHQPRTAIWDLLHQARCLSALQCLIGVVVLSEGVQLYGADPRGAVAWFGDGLRYPYDAAIDGAAADWLMDLVSVGFTKPNGYAPSWCMQFRVLLRRALLAQLRNPTDVTARLLLSCYVGLLAGLTFFDLGEAPQDTFQRLSALFFIMLLFELLPFCYMSFYVADRQFFAADVAAGLYHTSAYYLAHTLAALPFICLNVLAGGLTLYGLANLRYEGWAIGEFCALLLLQSLVAIQDLAYILATGYVALSLLLAGFYLRVGEFKLRPLVWLSYISYPRWTLQGMARVELGGHVFNPPGCVAEGMPGASSDDLRQALANPEMVKQALAAGFTCQITSSGDDILRYWDFTLDVRQAACILLGFYVALHLASYLTLSRMYRQKR